MENQKILEQISDLNEARVEHEVRIQRVESDMVEVKQKVDDMHKIANSVELIAHDMSNMSKDVSELKEGQTELKEDFHNTKQELKDRIQNVETSPMKKTQEKVDSVKDKLLWLFIGGVAAWVLTQLLPNIFK